MKTVKLSAPEGDGGVSHEDRHYPVIEGVMEVPEHLVKGLLETGRYNLSPPEEGEPAAEGPEPKAARKGKK